MTTKTKFTVGFVIVGAIATQIIIQQMRMRSMERENRMLLSLVAELDELDALRAENARLAGLTVDRAELERLRKGHLELMELRGEVGLLRDKNSQLSNQVANLMTKREQEAAQAQEAALAAAEEATEAEAEEQNAWISTATSLRNALISGQPLTEEELQWLMEAKPAIEQMEREPEQFSAFQSALIKATVDSIDDQRLAQIEKVISDTYQKAVAGGLDLPSKPAENYEDWVARRHALDRAATEAVQGLLTAEERDAFDSRFLGVMGVDLGTGVDSSNYPPGFLGEPPNIDDAQNPGDGF